MKLKTILVVIYIVILGQFLYSNFVQVIGPQYTIRTAAYTSDNDPYCPSEDGKPVDPIQCIGGCPLLTFNDVSNVPNHKGFPFKTNDFWSSCDIYFHAYASKDFSEARTLDLVYIVMVTGLYALGLAVYKVRSIKRQS